MIDFTNIRDALDKLLTAVDGTMTNLVSTVSRQRKELLALYEEMQATNADLIELGVIVGEAGATMLNIEEKCEDVATKVQSVIEGGLDETPDVNYEDFVGFCQVCGCEILVGEEYGRDGDGELVCGDCLDIETVPTSDADNQ
jgi:hypothetical protein